MEADVQGFNLVCRPFLFDFGQPLGVTARSALVHVWIECSGGYGIRVGLCMHPPDKGRIQFAVVRKETIFGYDDGQIW